MVIENAYYSEVVHGPFEVADIGVLVLEEGLMLRGCQLAHQTLGTLNDAKDDAVLATTCQQGNQSVMPDTYVGAGRAIDRAEHDVVIVNQIGSGLAVARHRVGGGGRNQLHPSRGWVEPRGLGLDSGGSYGRISDGGLIGSCCNEDLNCEEPVIPGLSPMTVMTRPLTCSGRSGALVTVEVAGIEPASSGTVTGLLRAQLAVCFSAPPITQASR